MGRSPPERPESDLWPERYGREIPPPLDPRGEIVSMSAVAGQSHVRRGGRPDEDAAFRRDHLRRVYAAYLRECVEGRQINLGWRGEAGNCHWMTFRAGYLAGQVGVCEDVALEDHEAWTERVMALPDGERPRILDTEEGPPPERPAPDLWPESYGREMPPPLDPRGEIVSIVGEAGQAGVILRGRRPKEDAIRRRDRLRRIYAAYLRECIEGWDIPLAGGARRGTGTGGCSARATSPGKPAPARTWRWRITRRGPNGSWPCPTASGPASSTRRKGRRPCCPGPYS